MSPTTIHVLGRVAVSTDAGEDVRLPSGQRQLLALLVAAGPEGASLDWLGDQLWADAVPTQWQASVRMALSRLRKRTGLPIPYGNGRYRLDVAVVRVDAWRLLAADTTTTITPQLLDLAAEPFVLPDLELSEALRAFEAEIHAAQRSLVETLCLSPDLDHTVLDRTVLVRFARHLDRDPTDERLGLALATALDRIGSRADAIAAIERCRTARAELGGAHGAGSTLNDLRPPAAPGPPAAPQGAGPHRPAPSVPTALLARRSADLTGRDREIASLAAALTSDEPATWVVRGSAGSGKTSLLAAVAERVVLAGGPVVYTAGTAGGRVALAPLVAVAPQLASELIGPDDQLLDSRARMARAASAFLDALARLGTARRAVLMVDDAQWLDGPTCEVLDVVARSVDRDHRPHLILASRTDRGRNPTPWLDLQRRLDRFGAPRELTVGPLPPDAVVRLVARHRPELSLAGRAQFARWLTTISQGLPLVITALMHGEQGDERAHPVTEIFDRVVANHDAPVRQVGGAAAVLGTSFDLGGVMELVGLDEHQVLDAVDELVERELIAETAVLDRFEFTHQLIGDAFARDLSASRRARMHARAAELAVSSHQRSRHLRAAGDLVDPGEARSAAVRSGRIHLRSGAFWEAGREFRVALRAGTEPADPETLVDYARALSLSGAHGPARGVRRNAYDLARGSGRFELAVDAAISGLPEAELPDGEADRYEALCELRPERLGQGHRFAQALHAARLASLLGRSEESRRWSGRATGLAASDDQRVAAALGHHFALSALEHPTDRLRSLRAALDGVDVTPAGQARVAQLEAIDLLQCGATAGARRAQREFARLADDLNDPLRRWHAGLFDALLHEIDGRWEAADGRADDALRHGRQVGIDHADITRLAQTFFRLRATRSLALLAGAVDQLPRHDGSSQLFAAARALILAAAGRDREAGSAVTALGREATSALSSSTIPCLALVAPLLRSADRPLRHHVRDLLEPFLDSVTVIGAGLGLVGPVRLLAERIDPALDPVPPLEEAVDWVDRADLRLLRVELRVELAAVTGSRAALLDASQLAEGSDLVQLLPPARV